MSDQRPPNAAVMFTGRDSVPCAVLHAGATGDAAACSREARRRAELSETNADRRRSRRVGSKQWGSGIWRAPPDHAPTGVSEPMSKAKERTNVTLRDRKRYARARARGKALRKDPVMSARYDESRDRIDLAFRSGVSMAIPRAMIPGLESASESNLEVFEVSPADDALSWPSLDVDVYVPGLVERAFGNRLFAAATGRRGGRRRSKAKAAASKIYGAKGGRLRKPLSAQR